MDKNPKQIAWYSSYEENNYGELFYSLIRIYQPEKVVELGTLAGYSAYHIARALRANGHGTLDCYDLWGEYIENNGRDYLSIGAAKKNLEQFDDIVKLELRNAIGANQKYQKVDILHIDLDNDATILEKIVPNWLEKVRQLIIIEGGSRQRDEQASKTNFKKLTVTKWLSDLENKKGNSLKNIVNIQPNRQEQYVIVHGKEQYKEKPIADWLENFSNRRDDFDYFTFEPFPSLTIIKKK